MHSGESSGQVAASSIERRVSRSTPSGQRRSVQASPTPPQERATSRNETSQYPAIGASSRLVASSRLLICRGLGITDPSYLIDARGKRLFIIPARGGFADSVNAGRMSRMRIQLGRELDKFVSELVATGFYRSESEVLREGLRLLKEREDLKGVAIESLRREVEAGARDAQRG